MEDHDRLLTRKEVCDAFHVGSKTIARWVRDGKLSEIITPGGYPRYRSSEVRLLMSFPPDDRPGHTSPPQAAGPVPPSRKQDRP